MSVTVEVNLAILSFWNVTGFKTVLSVLLICSYLTFPSQLINLVIVHAIKEAR